MTTFKTAGLLESIVFVIFGGAAYFIRISQTGPNRPVIFAD